MKHKTIRYKIYLTLIYRSTESFGKNNSLLDVSTLACFGLYIYSVAQMCSLSALSSWFWVPWLLRWSLLHLGFLFCSVSLLFLQMFFISCPVALLFLVSKNHLLSCSSSWRMESFWPSLWFPFSRLEEIKFSWIFSNPESVLQSTWCLTLLTLKGGGAIIPHLVHFINDTFGPFLNNITIGYGTGIC